MGAIPRRERDRGIPPRSISRNKPASRGFAAFCRRALWKVAGPALGRKPAVARRRGAASAPATPGVPTARVPDILRGMSRLRRHGPLPEPPALGAIAIDGGNVVAVAKRRARARLDLAVGWFRAWRPDLPVAVFLDHATFARCGAATQAELRALPECAVCPPGEPADVALLGYAAAHRALVVSNDRFFDHDALRANAIVVQFTLAGGAFAPFAEATWFRTPGQALRVALDTLRAR